MGQRQAVRPPAPTRQPHPLVEAALPPLRRQVGNAATGAIFQLDQQVAFGPDYRDPILFLNQFQHVLPVELAITDQVDAGIRRQPGPDFRKQPANGVFDSARLDVRRQPRQRQGPSPVGQGNLHNRQVGRQVCRIQDQTHAPARKPSQQALGQRAKQLQGVFGIVAELAADPLLAGFLTAVHRNLGADGAQLYVASQCYGRHQLTQVVQQCLPQPRMEVRQLISQMRAQLSKLPILDKMLSTHEALQRIGLGLVALYPWIASVRK